MKDKKRRPAKKRSAPPSRSPYFIQPAKGGSVTVLRRPAGNRIDAKLCGTMASRPMALALVKQLEKAESVVHDLFLEATDDGIEALEAVLEACRESVMRRADQIAAHGAKPLNAGGKKRPRGRRRGSALRGPSPGGQPDQSPQDGGPGDDGDSSAA